MCAAKYSAASSSRRKRSRLMPGGKFTRPRPRRNLFVPCALVVSPHGLLDFRIADQQKPPALHVSAARRANTGLQDLSDRSFGTGSGFNRRIDRVVRMISNRSAVFGLRQAWRARSCVLSAENSRCCRSIVEQQHARCRRSVFRDPRPTVLCRVFWKAYSRGSNRLHVRYPKFQQLKDYFNHVTV